MNATRKSRPPAAVQIEAMEARRMLSADLVPSFSGTLPAVLPPSGAMRVKLRVSNVGDLPARGAAQLRLFASADAALDSSDASLGDAVKMLRLNPGKSAAVKVVFHSPTSLPEGNYTLLAHVDTQSSAIADANAGNDIALAPTPVTVR